jgi:hypothetical protein
VLLVHENIRFELRCGVVTTLVDDEKPMLIWFFARPQSHAAAY